MEHAENPDPSSSHSYETPTSDDENSNVAELEFVSDGGAMSICVSGNCVSATVIVKEPIAEGFPA